MTDPVNDHGIQPTETEILPEYLMTSLCAQNGRAQGRNLPFQGQPDQTVRGSWTQQEDDQLRKAVEQLGARKWKDIARFVPTRTPKQCRERWHNRLNPEIKHEAFEPWEDEVILNKQKIIGNKWSLIAKELKGRSPSAIKNRWYSGLKSQHPQAHMPRMHSEVVMLHNQLHDEEGNSSAHFNVDL